MICEMGSLGILRRAVLAVRAALTMIQEMIKPTVSACMRPQRWLFDPRTRTPMRVDPNSGADIGVELSIVHDIS